MSTVRRCGIDMCRAKKCCSALVAFLYTFGLSHKSICEATGYNSATVGNIISKKFGSRKERGYVVRARWGLASIGLDALDAIEREYLAGSSTYELGEKYGVTHQTISKWMRERGYCRGRGSNPNSRKGREILADRVRKQTIEQLNENPAIELVEYVDYKTAQVRCTKCGTEYRWGFWSRGADEPCPHCRELLRIDRQRVRDRKQYEREQQRIAAREWRLSVPRICKECGEPFYSEHEAATYCCDKCRKRARHRKDAQRGTAGGYRKRLRIVRTKATYDPSVTLNAVYKRFKGKCCACGCKVYRSKEYRPDQATLDHIIALANNGTHTWDNVQLLCSDCNSKKRDIGQMRLPIAV